MIRATFDKDRVVGICDQADSTVLYHLVNNLRKSTSSITKGLKSTALRRTRCKAKARISKMSRDSPFGSKAVVMKF